MSIDNKYSNALYTSAKNNKWVGIAAKLGASNLIWLMFGFALASGGPTGMLYVFPPLLLAWGISLLISEIVKRPRPFQAFGFEPLIDLAVKTGSFPSEHTTIAFALAAMFLQNTVLTIVFLIAAVIVGLSRVAVGVHYLSDVLVGGVIGFLVGRAVVIAIILVNLDLLCEIILENSFIVFFFIYTFYLFIFLFFLNEQFHVFLYWSALTGQKRQKKNKHSSHNETINHYTNTDKRKI